MIVVYVSYLPPAQGSPVLTHVQTDGFSDNVFPKEMLSICSLTARRSGPEEKLPERIASNLVAYAQKCMHREDKISPFQRRTLVFFSLIPS